MQRLSSIWCFGVLLLLIVACDSRDPQRNIMKYFHALLERPCEPLNYPKGNILFVLPWRHQDRRFQNKSEGREDDVYFVKDLKLPDFNLTFHLQRDKPFSNFIPLHRKAAAQCIDALLEFHSPWQVLDTAALIRDKMNAELWTFCLQAVLVHHNATRHAAHLALHSNTPQNFFQGTVLQEAKEQLYVLKPSNRTIITLPPTATDLDPEHHLWYFREDVGINLHHWNWHLTYPYTGKLAYKNRRGELFYYFHQQIIARYNFERLCNKLNRVKPLHNFQEPIKEAYFGKLNHKISSHVWPSRMAYSMLNDVHRGDLGALVDIGEMERWRDNIYKAVYEGRAMQPNYEYVSLFGFDGIDILGNMMEASSLNINSHLYGNLHNMGHLAIALIHDPDNKYLESFSVMGNTATAMRDPVFYRWHKFVDDIFQTHKATLPPYTRDLNYEGDRQLQFPGVSIKNVTVKSKRLPEQVIFTYWQTSTVELSRGLDFAPRGAICANVKHLQHTPFTYQIRVNNDRSHRQGTVRIFMAPKFNEQGDPYFLVEQRTLFIELDRFEVDLDRGWNLIERSSTESSVTIPYSRTFRHMDPYIPEPSDDKFNFCGCGWPDHMLIPKGTPEGFQAQLFVMISDYTFDRVDELPPEFCRRGSSFCGNFDQKYPDARPMGYPFDRPPEDFTQTIHDFLSSNMFVTNVTIQFKPDFLNSTIPTDADECGRNLPRDEFEDPFRWSHDYY